MSEVTIQAALAKVMADVREVAKRDRNESQRFNFRGIDAVVNAVGPALRTHDVVVMPHVEDFNYGTVTSSGGKPMGHVTVKVRYRFTGPAGDHIDCVVMGEAMDIGDKATPKAMSVAFRTALLQALALPTDDPDPDSQNYERSSAPEPAKPAKKKNALTDEMWTTLVTSMTLAKDLTALDEVATKAATYELSDDQRNELKALYLERKAMTP